MDNTHRCVGYIGAATAEATAFASSYGNDHGRREKGPKIMGLKGLQIFGTWDHNTRVREPGG